ncbi:MAG: farnesyl-diphosphate farnesyltransferase [Halothiobacillaceae bacterium]|nr:MAG: farnesyl-diphosphate farnesyltransferase [Halothiobacillaceae bacterium]
MPHDSDLEEYLYQVAGCVGGFWTEVAAAHGEPFKAALATQHELGICYGKALQLTNILRDLPKDLRMGRCYLPGVQLRQYRLTVAELLDPNNSVRTEPLLQHYLDKTLAYYQAAQLYLFNIPRRSLRHRLAVLWPQLIGLATLAKLAHHPRWLDPTTPAKVSRRWIYTMLLLSLPAVLSNTLLRGWLGWLHKQVHKE